jgi:type IV pilus assembly protein PilC
MAVYQYTAKDEAGNALSGTCNDVSDVAALREELAKMGCVGVKVRRVKSPLRKRTNKIKSSHVVPFAYRFAGMYSAGLPITKCLEVSEQETDNEAFKNMIADVRHSVETGSSLKGAFEKYRSTFSDFFLGMVEAGEAGGKLATALEMSATYLEKQADVRRKVKAAFAYPLIVGLVSFAVVGCLVVFVVPVFSKIYKQMHVPLPGPTQALVNLSSIVRGWWWATPIVALATAIIIRRLSRDPRVKAGWDVFKLRIPYFAKLNRMVVVSHFTRTFAMLASVGVSLIEALDVASVVVHNHKVTQITKGLQESIGAGNPLAESLRAYDIFPPIIVQMASSGEQAGQLPDMLNKGADFLDRDIDRTINALLVKLEPALTIIMGVIVGFILMAVYLPMFDYMRHLE